VRCRDIPEPPDRARKFEAHLLALRRVHLKAEQRHRDLDAILGAVVDLVEHHAAVQQSAFGSEQ
jgi:hypothetical protein